MQHLYDRGGAGVLIRSDGTMVLPNTDGHGCPDCGACGLGGHGGNCAKSHLAFHYDGHPLELP